MAKKIKGVLARRADLERNLLAVACFFRHFVKI